LVSEDELDKAFTALKGTLKWEGHGLEDQRPKVKAPSNYSHYGSL
jgi:hypothetical protein